MNLYFDIFGSFLFSEAGDGFRHSCMNNFFRTCRPFARALFLRTLVAAVHFPELVALPLDQLFPLWFSLGGYSLVFHV